MSEREMAMIVTTVPRPRRQRGISMIEVLVTIVILSFGLLGLVGLQSRLQVSEVEAYQRAQALILLQDMSSRMTANHYAVADYVTGADSPLGTGASCSYTSASSRQVQDSCEWSNALQGAAETVGDNATKIGAMAGARGCVESLGNNEYLLTVAWQGMAAGSAPPASVGCAKNLYDGAATSSCTADRCRRTVTTIVRIATLT
jgi:type IV pilus assembly protein PilV